MTRTRPVVVDLQALQSPGSKGRGIGRYALDWACAIEVRHPDLVEAYLLNAKLAPPGTLDGFPAPEKVHYREEWHPKSPPAIYHLLSPFDLHTGIDALFPLELSDCSTKLSATVYDLLPSRDLHGQLVDPVQRHAWRTRLELVRGATTLLTLSSAVAEELCSMLGSTSSVHVVGAAPSKRFLDLVARSSPADRARRCARVGITKRFVLAPSGSHPRKNNEALIESFARLDAARSKEVELAITGSVNAPTAHHYRYLAEDFGIAGSVHPLGHVEEEDLVALYLSADLVCVASLGEGFGLPVAEAIACASPVICSDLSPFDELVDAKARFDPYDRTALTRALHRGLSASGPTELLGAQHGLRSWDEIADASQKVFEGMLTSHHRRPRSRAPRRARIAVVSPLPPAPSGVAGYSYRLLEALSRHEELELCAFWDGPTNQQVAPEGIATCRASLLRASEQLCARFQAVIYAIGNSHHHLGALSNLRRRPGVVLAHDVRLTNLYLADNGDPGFARNRFDRACRAVYEGLDLGCDELSPADLERQGLLLAREVVARSSAFLVSSAAAANLARLDAGPAHAGKIAVLPFAFAGPDQRLAYLEQERKAPQSVPPQVVASWGRGPDERKRGPLIAHFGIVDKKKQPELLISALAALRENDVAMHRARLFFVGPVADALLEELSSLAVELGVEDALGFTGPLAPSDYGAWLERVDLAVQLRSTSNGEASAAVGECLYAGVPTIVSAIGWSNELDERSVEKVGDLSPSALAQLLFELLRNDGRREELATKGREEALRRSFDRTATALVEILGSLKLCETTK